jgi:hypothetical protein
MMMMITIMIRGGAVTRDKVGDYLGVGRGDKVNQVGKLRIPT